MIWGLVPFFYDKKKEDAGEHLGYLKQTIAGLKKSGVEKVVVVDDGSEMGLEKLGLDCELITREINEGKTAAVLSGLKYISEKDIDGGYIIQCDYDADQNSEDAGLILSEFEKEGADNLGMVIGDRYKNAQQDPLQYRKVMLHLQEMICKQMGYDLRDTVSGLRGYTTDFGKDFLLKSKAKGFGSDTEQLVIAYLEDLAVLSVPLTYSRKRGVSTPDEKLVEVMNAVLAHSEELRDRKLDKVVDLFERLKENLVNKELNFEIDLKEFGADEKISFIRDGKGMYTADMGESLVEKGEMKIC